MHRLLLVVTTLALLLTGCGSPVGEPVNVDLPDPDGAVSGPAAGACPEGTPDCVDADLGEGPSADVDPGNARAQAQALLGLPEDEVPDTVRVGRRGDEQFALTEDYVVGRVTVELDDDGDGTYRVTAATVELPGGPETLQR